MLSDEGLLTKVWRVEEGTVLGRKFGMATLMHAFVHRHVLEHGFGELCCDTPHRCDKALPHTPRPWASDRQSYTRSSELEHFSHAMLGHFVMDLPLYKLSPLGCRD